MSDDPAGTVCICGHSYYAHDAGECWVTVSASGDRCPCSWQEPAARAAVRTEPIEDLVERSSLGTPEAQRLRESVSDEDAREVVRRAAAMRTEPENG